MREFRINLWHSMLGVVGQVWFQLHMSRVFCGFEVLYGSGFFFLEKRKTWLCSMFARALLPRGGLCFTERWGHVCMDGVRVCKGKALWVERKRLTMGR
jgi:hypothetical protein